MNEYRIELSYMVCGERVHEIVYTTNSRAADAADDIRREYVDLDGLRIEQVWIDTGNAWEVREFDY